MEIGLHLLQMASRAQNLSIAAQQNFHYSLIFEILTLRSKNLKKYWFYVLTIFGQSGLLLHIIVVLSSSQLSAEQGEGWIE